MDIIANNPYRYLGVYSNSPTKERVANKGKMNAFLKVGRPVSFPLDLPAILPNIERTVEAVTHAESELTLPIDQIKFAQFWWMNVTPLDGIAFNHLISGNAEMAKSIWDKKDNVSSLQNRLLFSVINEDWDSAIGYAELLYTNFSEDFVKQVLGESITISTPLWQMLMDTLIHEQVDILSLLNVLHHVEWKNYIAEKTTSPLIGLINQAIDIAKTSRGKDPTARFEAGRKLMESTKSTLNKLRQCLSASDIRYQTVVDKLATEILQCGIDYYNDSQESDCAIKAMKLQKYAFMIAIGRLTKDRCKENVDILQKVIDDLPPAEVYMENKAVLEELRKYCQLPDKIIYAINLLNNTKPQLQSIKNKLGAYNEYYLKISTQVVANALHNIIEEVNASQKGPTIEIGGEQVPVSFLLDKEKKIAEIKTVLKQAWEATLLMDSFDMESDFKKNRYNQNRSVLKNMCNQLGVRTTYRSSEPKPYVRTNTRTTDNSNSGSFKLPRSLAYWIGVLIVGCIGMVVNREEGFFTGCILGLFTVGPLCRAIFGEKQ